MKPCKCKWYYKLKTQIKKILLRKKGDCKDCTWSYFSDNTIDEGFCINPNSVRKRKTTYITRCFGCKHFQIRRKYETGPLEF
jgi:hypothetical protein